ncbi:MAG: Fe-S cluster assembly sulfur transfer protein SufU [Sphingomonadales bacterium]
MSDLRELYQELILDHGKKPRNFGPLTDANRQAVGHNPLCGDRLTVRLAVTDGTVTDLKFEGAGCAISMASASLMTQALKGRSEQEARELFEKFHGLVTGADDDLLTEMNGMEKLAVFTGVREFPMRVKCATLAWHTLTAALANSSQPVTTE